MPPVAIAGGIAASAAIGAAGNIAGGALAKPDKVDPKSSYYYPPSDPVLAGVSQEALMGMGMPAPYVLEQASPINQLINRINMNPGIPDSQKSLYTRALVNLSSKVQVPYVTGEGPILGQPDIQGILNKSYGDDKMKIALAESGVSPGELERLLEQEYAYNQQVGQIQSQYGDVQGDIFSSRLDTQAAISNLMGEVAGQYGGAQSPLIGGYMRNFEADINQTYDKQLEDVMRLANTTGYNPGRAISDLEDSRASALRNLGHQGTLQAEQIIALMQGSLQPAQQLASATAGTRTGQGIGAAGVAGNQASAINAITAQTNAQRAQAMGAGVAGAGNSLSQGLLLTSLLSGGPATGGGSGSLFGSLYG